MPTRAIALVEQGDEVAAPSRVRAIFRRCGGRPTLLPDRPLRICDSDARTRIIIAGIVVTHHGRRTVVRASGRSARVGGLHVSEGGGCVDATVCCAIRVRATRAARCSR
jgi:hypothetical protein